MITIGDVDGVLNGFDPTLLLTDWDTGIVSSLPDGRTLRTFEIIGEDKEIEIAPGILFPAWTYNGRVPGPSLRVTEGDRVRTSSGTTPHIGTRCTSTASTPPAWMASQGPGRWSWRNVRLRV